MNLTEKQREEILAERYNKRKELKARFELQKKVRKEGKSKSSESTSPRMLTNL